MQFYFTDMLLSSHAMKIDDDVEWQSDFVTKFEQFPSAGTSCRLDLFFFLTLCVILLYVIKHIQENALK